ncbi:MAG: hypothetical protein IT480_09805 [Gammaproteobacteria bacterium]|nr:hypothetical protein [Gammaproteobacteria bacterium]
MSAAQGLLLVAVFVAAVALLRAIHATLRELEPAAWARPWPWPFLHPPIVLIAHFAERRLRLPWRAALRSRLLAAGFADRPTTPEWFALRCLAGALALTAVLAAIASGVWEWPHGIPLLAWAAALLAGLIGLLAPEGWLQWRTRRRLGKIDEQLDLYLEMLLAGLEAGLDWRASLRCAVRCGPNGPVREACAALAEGGAAGCDALEGLQQIGRRLHSPRVHQVVAELMRAQRAGTGPRRALYGVLAHEERRRLAQAEFSVRWGPLELARPLLAGGLPGLVLMLILL